MKFIGIKQFRDNLSHYLKEIKQGEVIYVTMHNTPVARITPVEHTSDPVVERMLADGQAYWIGGKPKGNPSPPLLKDYTITRIVVEDRR